MQKDHEDLDETPNVPKDDGVNQSHHAARNKLPFFTT